MLKVDAFLTNCRLADGRLVDEMTAPTVEAVAGRMTHLSTTPVGGRP